MPLDNYRARVNSCLSSHFSQKGALTENMRYSVLAGGKRFRPILTYTTASVFNVDLAQADSCACAVELIHIYSLIHDDLPAMDDDDMRHNQPANHKQFGEGQAILAGDGLQALAFRILTNNDSIDPEIRINLVKQLSNAAFEMAVGQSIDLSIVSKNVEINLLYSMHRKKTGALLKCSVLLGALLNSDLCSEDEVILTSFSRDIGLAYQIQDDVLDVSTPDYVLGKRQNSDAERGKPTFPSILGMDESVRVYESLYEKASEIISQLSVDESPLRKLTEKLLSRTF
jgi:farnesyl diphosphate synthase/geranylgeranyl diphosphate synthase type II